MRIGIIGDLHFRESMPYADYLPDRRIGEKERVLDFIVETLSDCPTIVFLGDALNLRNNPSEVIREFVAFVERFRDKEIYLIVGNHELKGNGMSAIDFMAEIDKKNWHVMKEISLVTFQDGTTGEFLPYQTKALIGTADKAEGVERVLERLQGADFLFHHHAVGATSSNGISTDTFPEIVLPKDKIEKKYKKVIGGHIHTPGEYGKTIVSGSVFCADMGETEKFIWKLETREATVEKFKIPGRGIYKLVNPSVQEIESILKHNVVKVIITDRSIEIGPLEKKLKGFDAHLIVEQFPDERKRVHFEEGAIDLGIDHLIDIYAEAKKIDREVLHKGYDLIK